MKKIKAKNLIKSFEAAALCAALIFSATGCAGGGNADKNSGEETLNGEVQSITIGDGAEDGVFIAPLPGFTDDFIRGIDISSILSEEKSGVKYKNFRGEEEDLFKLLAENGVNYIRVRVWNDPFDENGNGYGGGNNDAAACAEIGKRAADCGMKLNVDFHYSDFWADPSKQMVPKAWKNMNTEEKAKALYDYTVESLSTIIDAGADVGMVQIGNEINNGLAGEKSEEAIMTLLKSASKAVRDISAKYEKDIKIAIHYTEVDDSIGITKKALRLSENEIDYDIFGISYYPYWHGSLKNMKNTMNIVKATYGKDVCVLETAFPYTGDDGDGFGNSVSAGDIKGEYICSPQSQANAIWDIMKCMTEIGGLGVFYWEGAWIPVGSDKAANEEKWNEYGSGWASKYSVNYDPNDAGKYYGGCSWDNQALFDFDGNVLDSLSVFNPKYLKDGKAATPAIEMIKECEVLSVQGEELDMPSGVYAVFNDRSLNKDIAVTWNAEEIAKIDTKVGGEYIVSGETEEGGPVSANIKISYVNLLENPGFEEGLSPWKVQTDMAADPTDVQTKAADAVTGEKAFHWWSGSEDIDFSVEQSVTVSEDGNYNAFASIQGGDAGEHYVEIYVKRNGEEVCFFGGEYLKGWVNWQKLTAEDIEAAAGDELTIGMRVRCEAGGWGTMDDFCLYKD
ncbi:MAG: glycosyl hydrolase 53 family protein [Lachnospiraceae bacterium]|nr:glycosyl hydrolase 53 family protein [Lachnospiraceae bacterium]